MNDNKMVFNVNDMLTEDKKKIPSEEKIMGRPKKEAETLKTERVVCYLTKKEMKSLKELSETDDETVSNYVRKLLISHIKN